MTFRPDRSQPNGDGWVRSVSHDSETLRSLGPYGYPHSIHPRLLNSRRAEWGGGVEGEQPRHVYVSLPRLDQGWTVPEADSGLKSWSWS